jgi:hypothetical protein
MGDSLEVWELWFPDAGATGMLFSRSRINGNDVRDRVLVHAAPPRLTVTVRDQAGQVLAKGKDLGPRQPGPMSYLVRSGSAISLEDGWPTQADIGRVVLLPGGEAGILKTWWNAEDRSEWRWQVEFYNHR